MRSTKMPSTLEALKPREDVIDLAHQIWLGASGIVSNLPWWKKYHKKGQKIIKSEKKQKPGRT